jgi:hypothetical protein
MSDRGFSPGELLLPHFTPNSACSRSLFSLSGMASAHPTRELAFFRSLKGRAMPGTLQFLAFS